MTAFETTNCSLYGTAGLNYEATDPIASYYTDRATGAHAAKAP